MGKILIKNQPFIALDKFGINDDGDDIDADAALYISRAGIVNMVEISAINTFFLSIKAGGIYTKLSTGALYLVSPSSLAASLFNAMNSSFTLTYAVAASPTFSSTGWAFNGVDQYLKTGLIPSTDLTLNSLFIGAYSRTNSTVSGFEVGSNNADFSAAIRCSVRNGSGNILFNSYDNISTISSATSDCRGFTGFNIASSSKSLTKNGSLLTSSGTISGSLPALELYIGCTNNNGTAANFSNRELASIVISKNSLTSGEATILYNAIQTYNTNVIAGGRQV